MPKIVIIGLITFSILLSAGYTAQQYLQNNKEKTEQRKSFLKTEAVVTRVHPPRVTRYGGKQERYDIRFVDHTGKERVKFRCELAGGLKKDEKIFIYYNPENLTDDVVLSKE